MPRLPPSPFAPPLCWCAPAPPRGLPVLARSCAGTPATAPAAATHYSPVTWAGPLAAVIGLGIAAGLCGIGQGHAAAAAAEIGTRETVPTAATAAVPMRFNSTTATATSTTTATTTAAAAICT